MNDKSSVVLILVDIVVDHVGLNVVLNVKSGLLHEVRIGLVHNGKRDVLLLFDAFHPVYFPFGPTHEKREAGCKYVLVVDASESVVCTIVGFEVYKGVRPFQRRVYFYHNR